MATSVQMLQHYQGYKPGDVVSLADDVAREWVLAYLAVYATGGSPQTVVLRQRYYNPGVGAPANTLGVDGDGAEDSTGARFLKVAGAWQPAQSGTYARQFWVDSTDPKYGLPRDGSTDCTAALTAAHADLPSGIGTVYIPAGTFIAQGLPIHDGVVWQGAGRGKTVLQLPVSPTDHLFKTTGKAEITSGGIYDMEIRGAASGSATAYNGIDFSTQERVEAFDLHRLYVHHFTIGMNGSRQTSTAGMEGNDRWLHLFDCKFWTNTTGVYTNEHAQIVSCDFRGNVLGLTGRINDCDVIGTRFNYNQTGVQAATGKRITNTSFTGCRFYSNSVLGVAIDENSALVSSLVDGDTSGAAIGVLIGNNSNYRPILLSDVRFNQDPTLELLSAVHVVGAGRVQLKGCAFRGYSTGKTSIALDDGSNSTVVKDCYFWLSGGSKGIVCTGTLARCDFSDNSCYLDGDGQFMALSNLQYSKVIGNQLGIAGVTLTNPGISIASNGSNPNVFAENMAYGYNSGAGVAFNIDARVSQVGRNSVTNGVTFTINNSDAFCNIKDNQGLRSDNNGTATITAAATSIAVAHGLARTPGLNDIAVTPTNNLGTATKFWISGVGSSTFTINVDQAPGAATATFAWQIRKFS